MKPLIISMIAAVLAGASLSWFGIRAFDGIGSFLIVSAVVVAVSIVTRITAEKFL